MSAFRDSNEPDAKLSMTRIVMFAFVVLAYIAVWKGRDGATVSAIIVGGVGAALAKAWETTTDTKAGTTPK